jgi:Tol biopolymer transport system component
MNAERWQRAKEIYQSVVEQEPQQREAFLAKVCAGDELLRKEVESLLAYRPEAESLMASPALNVAAQELAREQNREPVADLSGHTLLHYRVEKKIGEGGMGVVYRAEDTKLDRQVAIKVLPDIFSIDPERLARFEREARLVASLNHPNIAAIYGLEEAAGKRFLVLELVEGETLALRIASGPLPIDEALKVCRQIAEGLEYAHERGIIHRDLKPANIKLTVEGQVKVLDFGLAKAQEAAGSVEDSPTLTVSATRKGTILGTVAYMSPEQASGKPVGKRADIWSFGVVLWELLTGHRLFEAETVTHTLAEVLRSPIDFDKLPRETPTAIRGLLRRCLDRDMKNRLRDIGEARIAIEATLAGETPLLEGAPEPGGARRPWLGWVVAVVLAVSLAPFAFLYFRERPPAPAAPMRLQIAVPENATWPNLSPDGRKLAFIAEDRLWVHLLESGESRDLTVLSNGVPFWSPDSQFIGYPSEGKLKRIEATGGSPLTVADFSGAWGGGAWNQDDVIVFGERQVGLFRVPASGGIPIQITALDPGHHENSQFCPSFLADGRHFVYIRASTEEANSAIYLGSVDARPEQQSSKPLVASNSQPVYAPSADPSTGYLLFVREGTLMAQPFDNRRLELKGQAAPIAEQVSRNLAGSVYVAFSASANDVLAVPRGAVSSQLTWYDREGKVMGTTGEPGAYAYLALSPDGTRLAVTKWTRADAANIWVLDLSRGGASTRFTFGSLTDTNPVWSPDGSRIIFSSNRDGPYNMYLKPANGVKDEELLLKSSEDKHATSWSRDGRFLLYTVVHPKTKEDIWVLRLGDKKQVSFLSTEFNEGQARFSPDGHWVAYTSDESGQDEVYVRSFSMNSAGTAVEAGGKCLISNGFGVQPTWRGDGRELYYRSHGGRILAVEIATNPAFRAGNPQPLGALTFALASPSPLGGLVWDSAADGRRFLMLATKNGSQPYTVVLNWQAGLKK